MMIIRRFPGEYNSIDLITLPDSDSGTDSDSDSKLNGYIVLYRT